MKISSRFLGSLAALSLLVDANSLQAYGTDVSVAAITKQNREEAQHPEMQPTALRQLLKNLDLSQDQMTKAEATLTKESEQLKTVSNDSSLSSKQKREKSATIGSETVAELRALLTTEQRAKFDKALAAKTDKAGSVKKGSRKTKV